MREINFLKLPSVSENRHKEYNQIFFVVVVAEEREPQ